MAMNYAITLPSRPGTHAPAEVVVVHPSPESGPEGRVYTDSEGRYRFRISGDSAELLTGPGPERACNPCLHAVPVR